MVSKEKLEEIHKWDEALSGLKMPSTLEIMERYSPEVLEAYWDMRNAALMEEKPGGLTRWMKELILVANEASLCIPWGAASHARNAIKLGATAQQVQETVQLVLMNTGMATYATSGHIAVAAAEEEEKGITGFLPKGRGGWYLKEEVDEEGKVKI